MTKFVCKVRTRAYAQCGYCGRYSDDPMTIGDNPQPLCDCGERYGWCGSFVPPSEDSKWSGAPETTPEHVTSADCWCEPTVEYRDPETGVAVYVHKEIQ
jgi:hypothetical protein